MHKVVKFISIYLLVSSIIILLGTLGLIIDKKEKSRVPSPMELEILKPTNLHMNLLLDELICRNDRGRILFRKANFLNKDDAQQTIGSMRLCKICDKLFYDKINTILSHCAKESFSDPEIIDFLSQLQTCKDNFQESITCDLSDFKDVANKWDKKLSWIRIACELIETGINLCNKKLTQEPPVINQALLEKLSTRVSIKKRVIDDAFTDSNKEELEYYTLCINEPTKISITFAGTNTIFAVQKLNTSTESSTNDKAANSKSDTITHDGAATNKEAAPEQASIIPTQVLTQQEILDRSKNYKGPDKFDLEKLMERHNNPTPVDKAIKDVLAKLDERSNNVSLCSKMLVHVFSKLQVIPEFANDAEAQDTLKLLRDLSFFDKQGSKNFIMWSNEWVSEGFILEQQRVADAERSMSKAALVLSHKFGQYKQTPNTPEEEQSFKSISDTMAQLRAENKNMG